MAQNAPVSDRLSQGFRDGLHHDFQAQHQATSLVTLAAIYSRHSICLHIRVTRSELKARQECQGYLAHMVT